jgi:hypothetical protein
LQIHIKGAKDLFAGLLFVIVGSAAAFTAYHYPMGTAARMGPGYFPFLAGCGLALVGVVVAARAVAIRNDGVGAMHLKPVILILGAVALFAATIESYGLAVAIMLVVGVGYLANPRPRVLEAALLAVVLTAVSIGIFAYGLKLPFKVWPV